MSIPESDRHEPDEDEQRVDDLVLDGLEVDLHRAELRIADLRADAVWHRLIAQTAVASVRCLTHTVDRLRDQHRADVQVIQELSQELSELYQVLPTIVAESMDDHADVH
jgi:hypothetical protein